MGDVDIALRQVATRHPEDLARRFIPPEQPIASMRWLDTQLAVRELRTDKGLLVDLGVHRVAIHCEWFIDYDAGVAWRMYDYGCQIQEAVRQEDDARRAEARAHAKKHPDAAPWTEPAPLFVESCAVVLDGPAAPLPEVGAWRITPPGTPAHRESVVRFRIDAVYQRSTAELIANAGLLWLVFAPLARDASIDNLRLAVQAARQRAHSRQELEDLAAAMHILAVARPKAPSLSERIVAMFKEEGLIERTWIFQHGLEKGIEKGIEKGREEGIEKGRVETLRHAVLAVLASRGLRVTAAQRARIEAADVATLDAWLVAAAQAKTTGAALRATAKA